MQYTVLVIIFTAGVGAFSALRQENVRYKGIPFQDPCEPTPEPNVYPPGNINVSLHGIFAINEGSTHQGAVLTGHSNTVAEIEIVLLILYFDFYIDVPDLKIEVNSFDGSGYIDFTPMTSITTGTDNGMMHIKNLRIEGNLTFFINLINNKVTIRILNFNVVRFDLINVDFGTVTIGGEVYDWDEYSVGLKAKFDADFANSSIKDPTVEKIRVATNYIVGEYTLDELIDLIDGGENCP